MLHYRRSMCVCVCVCAALYVLGVCIITVHVLCSFIEGSIIFSVCFFGSVCVFLLYFK